MGRVFSVLAVLAVLMLAAVAFLSIRPLALPPQVEPLADWLSERGRLERADAQLKPDITHARAKDAQRPVVEDLTSRAAVAHVAIDEKGRVKTQAPAQDAPREAMAQVAMVRASDDPVGAGPAGNVARNSASSRATVAPPHAREPRATTSAQTNVRPLGKRLEPLPQGTRVASAAAQAEPARAQDARAQTPGGPARLNNGPIAALAPTPSTQRGDRPKTRRVDSASQPVARGSQSVKPSSPAPAGAGQEIAGRTAQSIPPAVTARPNQASPLRSVPAPAQVAPLPAIAAASRVTTAPPNNPAPSVSKTPVITPSPAGAVDSAQRVAARREPGAVNNALAGGAPGLTGSAAAASAVLAASAVQAARPVAGQSESALLSAPQRVALIPPSAPAVEPQSPQAVAQQVSIQNYLTGRVVEFQVGRDRLTRRGLAVLDQLVPLIEQNPQTTIIIQGHTDDVGDEISNLELSGARAIAARAYLMSRGIDGSRLQVQGFGEMRPIADNTTETGRIRNRRIDFAVSDPG